MLRAIDRYGKKNCINTFLTKCVGLYGRYRNRESNTAYFSQLFIIYYMQFMQTEFKGNQVLW